MKQVIHTISNTRAGVRAYLFGGFRRALFGGLCLFSALCASPGAATEAAAQGADAVQTWAIPAGPLSEALTRFATEAGLYLAGASEQAEGKVSPGLNGRYPTRQALTRLLAGSGLAYRFVDASTVTLEPEEEAEMLPPLTVEGEAQSMQPWLSGDAEKAYRVEDVNVGVLGNKILKDTPYSVEVYSSDLIKNKQARSLADITKGDASISLMNDNLKSENNVLKIRGLQPDWVTGQKIDGLNAYAWSRDIPLEHLERIDILKGAGGFLYGFGQPGGVINYVLKRPTDQPFQSLSMQVMDSGLALIHGDAGGRLGTDDRFGYRVNLIHESGDNYINDGESRRNSGSIALDWEITPDLVWRFDALLGKHMRTGAFTMHPTVNGSINFSSTAIGKPPAPIDGSRRLVPSWSRFESSHEIYGTDLSWDFAENWILTLAHRQSKNDRGLGDSLIFADSAGNYSISIGYYQAVIPESSQSQAMINGIFTTGPISHELAVGVSYTEIRISNTRDNGFIFVDIPNVGNLSNPVEVNNTLRSYFNRGPHFPPVEVVKTRRRGLFLSDTLRIGEDWDLILGLRHSNLDDKYSDYDKSAITPTIATVFRPVDGLSLYGSYIEALEQGPTAPDRAANAGQVFPPTVSKQYEFGAKAEADDWSASAALFRIERALTYTTPANMFTQDGEARYQGLELNGKFRLSPSWLLTASAMWLDATNQKTTGGALDGKRMVGVAREQLSLYGEYRMPGLPLTLTAGARYEGKRPVDPANRFYVGDVTLFDTGARYETKVAGKGLTLRLNVDNLTDEAYWFVDAFSRLTQGMPRTFKLGIELEW